MTAPAIEVLSLFPTPIGLVVMPNSAAINRALGPAITKQWAAAPDDARPWRWEDGFRQVGGEPLTPILEAAQQLANQMTPTGGETAPRWHITCRAHVLSRNQSLPVHARPGAVWAASYIVDDGGEGEQSDAGGALEFQDPRGSEPAMYAPALTFAVPGGESIGISQTIGPASGLLVVYPAWLLHGVSVFRGNGNRISVAIELSANAKAGA
jgi:hypothetical protein